MNEVDADSGPQEDLRSGPDNSSEAHVAVIETSWEVLIDTENASLGEDVIHCALVDAG